MIIQSYLMFEGRCEEALEFYKRALGAEVVMLMRHKDNPEAGSDKTLPPGSENKVMHSELRIGDTTVMATDGFCTGKPEFKGFSLSIGVDSLAAGERCFKALAQGGEVTMPLGKTFWSPGFGMVVDKFGVHWMINVAQAPA